MSTPWRSLTLCLQRTTAPVEHAYKIHFKEGTLIKIATEEANDISKHMFKFVEFDTIPIKARQITFLIDVIGVLKKLERLLAIVFSTGGYTGNVYHDFNDGLIPLYGDVLSRLSNYHVIDFSNDKRTHCFPETKHIGIEYKDGFQRRKKKALLSSSPTLSALEEEKIGFKVKVLKPDRTTELAKIYQVLNSTDAMVGVHGAAMTHFLFMRPSSVLIQIIPLGTDWAAETYYGVPSRKFGLKQYKCKRVAIYQENLSGWAECQVGFRTISGAVVFAYVYTISKGAEGVLSILIAVIGD
ncbi:hypothetical protein IFM89_009263 [Coptis chinensis]|uniref:Glycosyltransferase 61 catalytic domain-containing protein n=1 Tax=Coptis chinensis TaxID=261450 RepID=A0A835IBP2_9MAGN|nr:hypothetical protein IFM89_009263 [Coptis chinensis]